MSSHFEGHTVGKDRCDAFLASLQEIDPGVERDIGRNSCSFRIGGQAALCHVYHLKTRSDLTVWVRSASISDEGAHGFEIRRRESTGTGWAERFPAKFKLTEDASINDAAVLALECLTPPVQPRMAAQPERVAPLVQSEKTQPIKRTKWDEWEEIGAAILDKTPARH